MGLNLEGVLQPELYLPLAEGRCDWSRANRCTMSLMVLGTIDILDYCSDVIRLCSSDPRKPESLKISSSPLRNMFLRQTLTCPMQKRPKLGLLTLAVLLLVTP